MSNQIIQVEGITLKLQPDGSIKAIIHTGDLITSLKSIPTLNNGTHVLLARQRSTASAKGHSHDKPTAKVWLSQEPER